TSHHHRHSVTAASEEDEELNERDSGGPTTKCARHSVGKSRWTREEDEKLKKLIEHHGSEDWKLIASFLPKHTDVQCHHRWQKVLNPELVKGPWTKEEDQKVRRPDVLVSTAPLTHSALKAPSLGKLHEIKITTVSGVIAVGLMTNVSLPRRSSSLSRSMAPSAGPS
uniref:MYB proto-onco, transcription factor n=1 Tax=Scleropages formosus TaxID=113540 RepID=A0A8D0CGG8_SCLFO